MSTSEDILHEIVLEDRLWIITNYADFSSTALWVIDLLQTLPMEISMVWSRKPTGSAVIFLLNRYMFGIYLILNVMCASPGSASDESCSALDITADFLQVITLLTTNRLALISGKSPVLLVALPAEVNLLRYQCVEKSICPYKAMIATMVVLVIPLVFDTIVFVITLMKTYRHFLEMREHKQRSLTGLLLRDGTLYFFVVFAVATANLALEITSVLNVSEAQTLLSELLQPYLAVAPNILINRLYLNLRAVNRQTDTVTPEYNHGMREISFAQDRFLGNIGAPLDPDWWNTQFDDDEGDGDELTVQDGPITPTGNNGATTLVPVVYDGEGHGDIEMVPIHRESETPIVGLSRSVDVVA